jgi:hypothetical protein
LRFTDIAWIIVIQFRYPNEPIVSRKMQEQKHAGEKEEKKPL